RRLGFEKSADRRAELPNLAVERLGSGFDRSVAIALLDSSKYGDVGERDWHRVGHRRPRHHQPAEEKRDDHRRERKPSRPLRTVDGLSPGHLADGTILEGPGRA